MIKSVNMDILNKSTMFGDWDKVGRWLNEKKSTYERWGADAMEECTKLYYKNLTEGIQKQQFNWAPLTQAYLERKIKMGYPALMLIATGDYLAGIKIQEMVDRKGLKSIFVGADNEAIHEPSGLPMSYLGAIHEYGTRDGKIPARPHYRPAWELSRNECKRIWLRHFREYAKKK